MSARRRVAQLALLRQQAVTPIGLGTIGIGSPSGEALAASTGRLSCVVLPGPPSAGSESQSLTGSGLIGYRSLWAPRTGLPGARQRSSSRLQSAAAAPRAGSASLYHAETHSATHHAAASSTHQHHGSHHHHAAAAAAAAAATADHGAVGMSATHHSAAGGGDHAHGHAVSGSEVVDTDKPHAHKPTPASTDGPRRSHREGAGSQQGGGGAEGRRGGGWLRTALAMLGGALLGWAMHSSGGSGADRFSISSGSSGGEQEGSTGVGEGGVAGLLEAFEDLADGAMADLGEAFTSASVIGKAAMLMLATVPMLAASGWLYRRSSPGTPWTDALLKAFSLLFRVPLAPERSLASYAVVNATFLCGFFSFALLLSIVSEEVAGRLDTLRAGTLPVRAENHWVILNWNAQLIPLLRQLARPPDASNSRLGSARRHRRGPGPAVAILADRPKAEMDEIIKQEIWDKGYGLEVHTRSGAPCRASDLKHVGADRAARVICLTPEDADDAGDAAALEAAAVMSVTALTGPGGGTLSTGAAGSGLSWRSGSAAAAAAAGGPAAIVVQLPPRGASGDGPGGVPPLSAAAAAAAPRGGGRGGVEVLASSLAATSPLLSRLRALEAPGQVLVDRLVASAACQPGALPAWRALLDPAPRAPQLRVVPAPLLQGSTFKEARRRCRDLWPVGIIRSGSSSSGGGGHDDLLRSPDHRIVLNPAEDEILREGDRLLVLATGGPGDLRAAAAAAAVSESGRVATDAQEAAAEAAARRLRRAADAAAAAAAAEAAAAEAAAKAAARRRRGWWGGGGADKASAAAAAAAGRQEVLVLGWPMRDVPLLLEALAAFTPPHTRVTIVSNEHEAIAHAHTHDNSSSHDSSTGGNACWHQQFVSESDRPAAEAAAAAAARAARRSWLGWLLGSPSPPPPPPLPTRTVRFLRAPAPLAPRTLAAAGIATCDTLIVLPPNARAGPQQLLAGLQGSSGGSDFAQQQPCSNVAYYSSDGYGMAWKGGESQQGTAGSSPWIAGSRGRHISSSAQPAAAAAPPPPQAAAALPALQQLLEAQAVAAAEQPAPPLARDAHVLSALLQVQDALLASSRRGPPPHVVTTVATACTAELGASFFSALRGSATAAAPNPQPAAAAGTGANTTNAGKAQPPPALLDGGSIDFVAPDEVVASLLAQLAAEGEYSRVVQRLLLGGSGGSSGGWAAGGSAGSSGGATLRVWEPSALGIEPGTPLTVAELSELARLKGATALGVVRAAGATCELAPAAGAADGRLTLAPGDRVAVIA